MRWIDVAADAALGEGESMPVSIGRQRVALVRSGGVVYAIEDLCTHDGEGLAGGAIEGQQIVCPRHGARFCLRTGEALTPPAYEAVRVFATKQESGRLWVHVE